MPTYEYGCKNCNHEFEVFQSISASPLETCPECGGKVQRLISGGGGLLFKGSGFYITDYRSSEYKSKVKSETTSTDSSAKTADSKTETKKPESSVTDSKKSSAASVE